MDFKVIDNGSYELAFSTHGIIGRANEVHITNALQRIDPDERDWGVHACRAGCWDSTAIYVAIAGTPAGEELKRLYEKARDYILLDDDAYFEIELEEAEHLWKVLNLEEKVELCQKARISIFRARHAEVPCDVIPYMHLVY